MTHRFYQIGIQFPTLPRSPAIDSILDWNNLDWVRFSESNWLIWTDKHANQLYQLIGPHLFQTEQIFIVAIDERDRAGMLTQWIWNWLDAKKETPDKTLAELLGGAYDSPPTLPSK